MKKLISRVLGIVDDKVLKQNVSNYIDEQTKNPQNITNEEQPGLVCATFVVNEYGSVSVDFECTKTDESMAEVLGTLLYYISSGKVGPQCEQVILERIKSNPEDKPFLRQALVYWKKNHDHTQDIVKPSDVFKLGNYQMRGNDTK